MAQEEINMKKMVPTAIIIIAVIFLIAFGSKMTVTIPAGHAGVKFQTFAGGIEKEVTYTEGFHLIAPWNDMIKYEIRQQEISEDMNVLSSNGLEIKVDISTWFRPLKSKLGYLHAEIGQDYIRRVVIPSVRASARSVIGRYTPEEIYSTKRDVIQTEIFVEAKKILDTKFIRSDKILIRSIILPATIKDAIESKLKQEQLSLEYEFKLKKASKEAERQRIEAMGKAKANDIVSKSLTQKILEEKGINATLKLAESPNAKVVIIGNSDNGMPIILGGNN
ncbi:MAG: prohibitin family protein [Bacteroidota bacterium]|nr:prohibitin family protein [Bacteroidota bacterium]